MILCVVLVWLFSVLVKLLSVVIICLFLWWIEFVVVCGVMGWCVFSDDSCFSSVCVLVRKCSIVLWLVGM